MKGALPCVQPPTARVTLKGILTALADWDVHYGPRKMSIPDFEFRILIFETHNRWVKSRNIIPFVWLEFIFTLWDFGKRINDTIAQSAGISLGTC